jgi:electron transfer flavoprotein beta subunit
MRIIVCIKQICHTYARTGMDPDHNFLTPEDKVYRVNPYDEAGLELALRVKELLGESEISLLTLGPIIAEAELRRCLAMGADYLYQIDIDGRIDPWGKSKILALAIEAVETDLVLCGNASLDKRNGQVGAFMAHHLRMPFVSAITDLTILKETRVAEVQRSAGRGVREKVQCPLPAVFSVDMGNHEPRTPTYENKKRAGSLPIQKLSVQDDTRVHKVISTRVFPPRPRPKRISAPDSKLDAYERIQQLLAGSRVDKKGMILSGTPESQAEGILSFLIAHGFLKIEKG